MNFEWIDCSFYLKKTKRNSEITVNLAPSYKLKYLNEQLQPMDINLDAQILFEKPLMYDQIMGWNWHKSWNIPDIAVEIASDSKAAFALKNMKRLFAEIYIVKPLISKQYSLCFEDLGLDGITRNPVNENRTMFSGLKYSATSYNSDGSKFHFLIVVYQQSEYSDEPWKVLLSKISTPVFVDSRKSAREAELIKLKRLSAFIEPFQAQQIQKKFIKKESKKQHQYIQEQIQNNLEGLYNYFGAANIRNKIKHPIFLAFKFNQCFSIFINSKQMEVSNEESQIRWIQKSLEQSYKTFQAFNKPPSKTENRKLILMIKGNGEINKTNYYKKILQFVESLQSEFIEICTQQPLHSHFKKFETNQQNLQLYSALKDEFEKSHELIYKNKELELKNQTNECQKKEEQESPQDENTVKAESQIQQEKMNNDEEEQEQEQNDEKSSDESDQQSAPTQSFQDQRVNIPLKSEINIDPLKRKAFKMSEIIKHHDTHKIRTPIKCQKNKSANEKQLITLNQLMRMQIEEMKKALDYRKKNIIAQANHASIQQTAQRERAMIPTDHPVKIQAYHPFYNPSVSYETNHLPHNIFNKYSRN